MSRSKIVILLFTCFSICLDGYCTELQFLVRMNPEARLKGAAEGRLFIVFTKNKSTELFTGLQYPGFDGNIFGVDVKNWNLQSEYKITTGFLGFPLADIHKLAPGKWYMHAVFAVKENMPFIGDPGNYYSVAIPVEIKITNKRQVIPINLSHRIPSKGRESTDSNIRFVKIKSQLLSEFWQRPMYLEAQIILPRQYNLDSNAKYPVVFVIGGFGTRYYEPIISNEEWSSPDMPQAIVVLLDSKAPYGDSYQMNSENNGPYGDATIHELIPYIERKFRCMGKPVARFLTGTSTGGWASLALQIFYPDFFNGVWSTCADPVDFRAMELVNIYEDSCAFINRFNVERPAMRSSNGEPRYTLRTSISAENMLGLENCYVTSGCQWGSWNAVFSPKIKKQASRWPSLTQLRAISIKRLRNIGKHMTCAYTLQHIGIL